MTAENHIQELALIWKTDQDPAILKQLETACITYLYDGPLSRLRNLDEDEKQELNLLLFANRGKDRLTELERSLASYDPGHTGRNGVPVPFHSFFRRKILQRMGDVVRTRPNFNPRNADRAPKNPKQVVTVTRTGEMDNERARDIPLDEAVLREVLEREIRSLFFEAVYSIKNENYRDPFLFSFLFSDRLEHKDLASLFGIAPGTINSNMKRASTKTAENFKRLLAERGWIEEADLLHALSRLASEVRSDCLLAVAPDTRTGDIIHARFSEKLTPAEIRERFGLDADELRGIEQQVVQGFFRTIETVRTLRAANPYPGDDSMDFYDAFLNYLNAPPAPGRTRADLPLDKDEYDMYELCKLVLPTGRQREQLLLQEAVAGLDAAGVRALGEAATLTPAEISAAINDPEAYATQYRILLRQLNIRTGDS